MLTTLGIIELISLLFVVYCLDGIVFRSGSIDWIRTFPGQNGISNVAVSEYTLSVQPATCFSFLSFIHINSDALMPVRVQAGIYIAGVFAGSFLSDMPSFSRTAQTSGDLFIAKLSSNDISMAESCKM